MKRKWSPAFLLACLIAPSMLFAQVAGGGSPPKGGSNPVDDDPISSFGAELGGRLKEARELHRLSLAARKAGDLRQALSLLEEALTAARAQRLPESEQAAILSDLGEALAEAGEGERSRTVLEAAVDLARGRGSESQRALALYRLGREQLLDHRPAQAVRTLEAVPELLRRAPDPGLERDARLTAAEACLKAGQPARARRHLEAALPLLEAPEHTRVRARTLARIGVLQAEEGDPAGARVNLELALSLFQRAADVPGEARTLDDLAAVAWRERDYVAAVTRWREAVERWERLRSPREVVAAWANISWAYEHLALNDRALEALEQALARLRRYGLRSEEAAVSARFGRLYLKRGQAREARTAFETSTGLRGLSFQTASWIAPLGLARALALEDDPRTEEAYRVALEALERASMDTAPGPVDAPWIEERGRAYEELIARYLEADNVEAALEVAERGRARAFRDLLEARAGDRVLGGAGEGRGITLAGNGPAIEEVGDRVEAVLAGMAPGTGLEKPPRVTPLTVAEIRAMVQAWRATLLFYHPVGERLAVWVVEPSGVIRGKLLPSSLGRIEQLAGWTLEQLSSGGAGRAAGKAPPGRAANAAGARVGKSARPVVGKDDLELRTLLKDLYTALLLPIEGLLPPEPERVAFITAGALAAVPFAALIDAEDHLFVQHHPVLTVPAAAFLTEPQKPKGMLSAGRTALFVVGDGARPGMAPPDERLEALHDTLRTGPFRTSPEALSVVSGPRATEEGLLELLSTPAMVQVVSRAFYHRGHPWLSGLVLARTGETPPVDGVFTAAELPWGEVHAKLVVLPPREGASAAVNRLEGLEAAWLAAGAHRVLMPLGSAGLTGRVAARFYEEVQRGAGMPEALRTAQLEALAAGVALRRVAGLTLAGAW